MFHPALRSASTRPAPRVRASLAWTPPAEAAGFRIVSDQAVAVPAATVLRPARWWRQSLPSLARVAAAVLLFAGGAALANVDVRFSKFFTFDRHRVEFIAQLFNLFNRANYNVPNGNVLSGNDLSGRPLFGQSTSLLPNINAPSRQVEFALRYQF